MWIIRVKSQIFLFLRIKVLSDRTSLAFAVGVACREPFGPVIDWMTECIFKAWSGLSISRCYIKTSFHWLSDSPGSRRAFWANYWKDLNDAADELDLNPGAVPEAGSCAVIHSSAFPSIFHSMLRPSIYPSEEKGIPRREPITNEMEMRPWSVAAEQRIEAHHRDWEMTRKDANWHISSKLIQETFRKKSTLRAGDS